MYYVRAKKSEANTINRLFKTKKNLHKSKNFRSNLECRNI